MNAACIPGSTRVTLPSTILPTVPRAAARSICSSAITPPSISATRVSRISQLMTNVFLGMSLEPSVFHARKKSFASPEPFPARSPGRLPQRRQRGRLSKAVTLARSAPRLHAAVKLAKVQRNPGFEAIRVRNYAAISGPCPRPAKTVPRFQVLDSRTVRERYLAGMTDLAKKRCAPCTGDTPRVPPDEVARLLGSLPGYKADLLVGSISKAYEFDDFYETMAFVNAVAYIANTEDHHPELAVSYSRCVVTYS